MSDESREFWLDLGKMSDEKAEIVSDAMSGEGGHVCDHPLTAHTGTEATFPWRICARFVNGKPCGCQVLME